MAFVKINRIGNNHYGYLVESYRPTYGSFSKHRVLKYLGPINSPNFSKISSSKLSSRLIKVEKKGKIIKTRKPEEVLKIAHKVEKQLLPLSSKLVIAGSIRRKTGDYKDIDMVVIPKDKEKIKHVLKRMGVPIQEGDKKIGYNINGVKTEVYFATPKDFGAQLLFATGSGGHNIGFRKIAKERGLKLNQYGLWKGKTLIASKTEKEIYKALHRPQLKKPEERY